MYVVSAFRRTGGGCASPAEAGHYAGVKTALLEDRLPHRVLEVGPRAPAGALDEEDRHELLLRFVPEADAGTARPPVRALRHAQVRGDGILDDLHAEAESHAARRPAELAVDHVAGMIGGHQVHRARAEKACAVQLALVEQHLRKLQVV